MDLIRKCESPSVRWWHKAALASGLLASLLLVSGCGNQPPWLPLRSEPGVRAHSTLLWVGRGECERYESGTWLRCPEFDYEFSVEQRRGEQHWESVKSLRRLHPDYDGSAGERAQIYYFEVQYEAPSAGQLRGQLRSSLGPGVVLTDAAFRSATIDIEADVGAFAPFDSYHITQQYSYDEGRLEELVELNRGQVPWVRNREVATLYGPVSRGAPKRRAQ